eukprot:TRINITY_DN1950_c0_g1_i1.p1 TRINITY_DN1950_c0_g1~~TRINITY_DN1950_c0_g1_i1.p1  ORF type:complete len:754 (+),score=227.87 TRINITY_DN1950_c0_g1_i1:296-2263(+)
MEDEIDIFHKQRDKVPLNVGDDDTDVSDEDFEQPVLDLEVESSGESEELESDDEEQLTGLAAKIAKQAKILRQKTGGLEEVEEDENEQEEDEEEKKTVWGTKKHLYYNADNIDYEIQLSDEETPAEEEAEVMRLQKQRAESLRPEDFGLDEDIEDETDGVEGYEETMQEAIERQEGKSHQKLKKRKETKFEKNLDNGTMVALQEVKKDINALSKEQQMDVVMSEAPELVGLLSEFKDGLETLKSVQCVMEKLKENKNATNEGITYLEVKHQLLLCYCQAIVFYLLLKAEGHSVRDHPVVARLVEIRKLLDRVQNLDKKVKNQFNELLKEDHPISDFITTKDIDENGKLPADVFSQVHSSHNCEKELNQPMQVEGDEAKLSTDLDLDLDDARKTNIGHQLKEQIAKESKEMLKERAKLEAYVHLLKDSINQVAVAKKEKDQSKKKHKKAQALESAEDFDDNVAEIAAGGGVHENARGPHQAKKISQLVAEAGRAIKRPKLFSGDDDLPEREDIGERRRKYESLRSFNADSLNGEMEGNMEISDESEDEFYKEVKQKRTATLSAKSEKHARKRSIPQPEEKVEGKRQITYQMEKNKGLTPHRKKKTKNPRKKYKLKHEKAVTRRKGQIREVKLPQGPYGGETTGIRTAISRSIRFKN